MFPGFETVVTTGINVGLSALQGKSKQDAAKKSNKEQKKINKALEKREQELNELDYLSKIVTYAQTVSANGAEYYRDGVKKLDYETGQSRIIDTALKNLDLNIEALQDKYITGESLRYLSESITYDDEAGKASNRLTEQKTDLALDSAQSRNDLNNVIATSSSERVLGISNAKATRKTTVKNNKKAKQQAIDNATATYLTGSQNVKDEFAAKSKTALGSRDTDLGINSLQKFIDVTSKNIDYQENKGRNSINAAKSNVENLQRVAGYMNTIKERNLQGKQAAAKVDTEGQNIQEQIVIQDSLDTLKRDAESITAILGAATARNSAVVRSGGSNSAEALAMDKMKQFGRTYGELQLRQQDRRRQISGYNSKIKGEIATQMDLIAQSIKGAEENIVYTQKTNKLSNEAFGLIDQALDSKNQADKQGIEGIAGLRDLGIKDTYTNKMGELTAGKDNALATLLTAKNNTIDEATTSAEIGNKAATTAAKNAIGSAKLTAKNAISSEKKDNKITQLGIRQKRGNKVDKFNLTMSTLNTRFNEILVPGFDLSSRQGQRELQSQVIGAQNTILSNATPYRDAIIEDPLPPIRGLKPQKIKSTSAYVPGNASIIGDAFVAGFSNVLDMSYTDNAGNLQFR